MKVVVLCGGLGTRLREETEFRPKPMVEVGGKPIIWHIMKSYAAHGFDEFVLALGYKGEMIKEYFYNYEVLNNDFTVQLGETPSLEVHKGHEESGWKVTLVDTGDSALKGARLKSVERYIDGDDFMVTYGDGVADVNVRALVDYHLSHGRTGTVTGVNAHARFGKLSLDGDRVTRFMEKPSETEDLINGGFFVFKRRFFDYLDCGPSCDLEYGALERLADEDELRVYRHPGFWSCMDNVRDMDYLNDLWTTGQARWKVW